MWQPCERRYAAGKALEQQLEADVLHAREVQEELLFEMIEANKDTPFGRDHGFADIKTVEDFKRTVPFTSYDDYAGYIYEVMERGTRGVVITEEIVHFNAPSGAMGNPKGSPYTKRMAEILMGYSGAYTYYRSYVGAGEGLAFYLLPDFERAAQVGLPNVITAAMNQSFFTLSLGIGAMEIFGSYMEEKRTLAGESVSICILDTFVALSAGLIIFPACFSFGVQPDSGPQLIFVTLPNVFANMAGGRVWGALFFLFMTFASFSTVIAVFENLLASCIDNFGWDRKKAVLINCVLILVLSLPCVLGYNVWSDLRLIGGRDVLDTEDFLVSNLLLPLGSLVYLLFCVTKWGWNFDNYLSEANKGEGMKMPGGKLVKNYFRFVLPVLILVILIQGLF